MVKWTMCDINCIWLFNLFAAVAFILLQQHQYVVASRERQQQLHPQKYNLPNDDISSYSVAAAANYLHHTSLDSQMVKREVKNGKNTDFISYMNDFNMQDETSIPEDIIDQQHLQEIIDKQQQGILQPELHQKLQPIHVPASTEGTTVLNVDGDIIDVNLPYDDATDTDSDADIILVPQRPLERTDYNKTSNNSNHRKAKQYDSEYNEMLSAEENEKDNPKKNFQKTNGNKKKMFKERKIWKNKADNQSKDNRKQQIKYENNIDYSNQYNSYKEVEDGDIKDPHNYDEVEDKFGLGEDDDDDDDDDDGSAEYERFKSLHQQKQKQKEHELQQESMEQFSTQITLIKDDINNAEIPNPRFDNGKINQMLDFDKENSDRMKNLNDYEIFHKHLLEERKKLLLQQQRKQHLKTKQDAIGDIEDKENQEIVKYTYKDNVNESEHQHNFGNIFVPRKMKRHNGFEGMVDTTAKVTRLKPKQEQKQQQQHQIKSEEKHTEAVAKVSSQEENFKKKYYNILKENSTSASDLHSQLHHHHRQSEDSNPKDFTFYDKNNERDLEHEVKRQTTFEKEKSLRRNSKHYGHKSHKKKYKDYLRYSQLMMVTTTSSSPQQESHHTNATVNSTKDNQQGVADASTLKDKHIQKLKLEKIKTIIPEAPIFLLKAREKEIAEDMKVEQKEEEPTTTPFYEGQINYFLEIPDDDSERANEVRFITKGERVDTSDWYRKLSPVLRNGNKKYTQVAEERSGIGVGRLRGGYSPSHRYRSQHQSQPHHGKPRNHHYHQQHRHEQLQHIPTAHHHQIAKSSRQHAYQRKMIPKRLITTTTPAAPPSRKHFLSGNGLGEVGHQITNIRDLDHYYAKWPHLAKVQSALHDEDIREQQQENYPDYEYDSEDDFEDIENKDDTLPPYIRKFNRRNKQLLDLLEGTISPPTKATQQLRWSGSKLQSGIHDSNVGSMSVRIDDDYLKEKRKRYHQRQRQIHDLFSQQRTSTTTKSPPPYPYVKSNIHGDEKTAEELLHTENHLPDEDVSISLESNEQGSEFGSNGVKEEVDNDNEDLNDSKIEPDYWQKEIETKSANIAAGNSQMTNWQMQKILTSTPTSTGTGRVAAAISATKKAAIHKLPSYPSIAGGYMNRPRSRSAQFAPSSGSEFRTPHTSYTNNLNNNNDNMNNNNNNFINAGGFVAYNRAPVLSKPINGRYLANNYNKQKQQQSVLNTTTNSPDAAKSQDSSSSSNSSNPFSLSAANSFTYHRVVDASPRVVGAGFTAGRKQRLPFVAITDRRLETSKKSLTDHQKDFGQNHYPLP